MIDQLLKSFIKQQLRVPVPQIRETTAKIVYISAILTYTLYSASESII